jgi:U6 snRNA-associated Sm-like protein LSm7
VPIVTGILKGYDQLLNLVLDEVEEHIQGERAYQSLDTILISSHQKPTEPEPHTRTLGLVVLRGPTITLLSPIDGFGEIANPFAQQE